MVSKYLVPLLAAAGLAFAAYRVVLASRPDPPSTPYQIPTSTPSGFDTEIAGAGLIEAKQENIPIGTNVPGIVWEVYVRVGQRVDEGDPLFRLDDRSLQADLKVRLAALASSEAELERLRNAPRPEDLPPARAAIDEAKAMLDSAESTMARSERLFERQMLPASDYDRDRFAYVAAKAALTRANAEFDRLQAGTWPQDILVAAARVEQARGQVEAARIEIDRLTVKALADGGILQVNVRPGQFASITWNEPMIVVGDLDRLNVRVDIDEHDLAKFRPEMTATAYLRGVPDVAFRLEELVKIEPYVVPKRSLTGDTAERVDTRVLQAVYALPDTRPVPLYVGQQMDVYIGDARPGPDVDAQPPAGPKTTTLVPARAD